LQYNIILCSTRKCIGTFIIPVNAILYVFLRELIRRLTPLPISWRSHVLSWYVLSMHELCLTIYICSWEAAYYSETDSTQICICFILGRYRLWIQLKSKIVRCTLLYIFYHVKVIVLFIFKGSVHINECFLHKSTKQFSVIKQIYSLK